MIDKRVLNFLVIIFLTFATFSWTFFIFHHPFDLNLVLTIIAIRIISSIFIFKDYSLSWSKVTQKTFLLKSIVYIIPFVFYASYYHGVYRFALLASELFIYLFAINFLMYSYYFYTNKSRIKKDKFLVIFGAGKAGLKLEEEFRYGPYQILYFVDDDERLQNRSIDGIKIISIESLKEKIKDKKLDLLVIAMPSADKDRIKHIYNELGKYFKQIKILPSLEKILSGELFSKQLKDISVEDLLARHPKDLDKTAIKEFIKDKTILITGGGGSIGSELSRQCVKYGAKKLILVDHSEYNLYTIEQELKGKIDLVCKMQSVILKEELRSIFKDHKPDIVIHAAAYKHVPLVEENISEAIKNNIIGTKNCIDLSIYYGVKKFILISTDKAVRPTNVMGATKRVCELYAQNVPSNITEIVAVRFGNVLGSSGSVVPKFKAQIEKGGPVTVTHPKITRYFMLIPEACQLVLQAGAIGKGGEIFILDMGEPVKIVDLAKNMIKLSGRDDIEIEFVGLRAGEKLYEELLIDESEKSTKYNSIFVAGKTEYDIDKLNSDIEELLITDNKIKKLKEIVPEFKHNNS